MDKIKDNILNEITNYCFSECCSSNCCPEESCILYRIEKIVCPESK